MGKLNFKEILEMSPKEIEAPKPLPEGVYEFKIQKVEIAELPFDFGGMKKGDDAIRIMFKPVEAIDVDEDELEAAENWKSAIIVKWYGASDMYRIADVERESGLAYDAGLDASEYDTIGDLLEALEGQHLLGEITHSPNKKNPDSPFVNLNKTAPLED